MQYQKSQDKIKKLINGMAGKYNRYSIFRDFIILSACTISNSVDKAQFERREKMYLDTIKKYDKKEANMFAEMLALTVLAYERRMGDFIGELYMTMEFSNRDSGQFFTPYDISKMMSQFIAPKPNEGIITLNEPSVGSGGMIVAYAETMQKAGYNYQTQLRVVCNDLDYDVVRMCYIQLSLLGIDAVVEQRNTLAPLDTPPGEIWYTPMHVLNKAKEMQREEYDRTSRMLNAMQKLLELEHRKPLEEPKQLSLFEEVL